MATDRSIEQFIGDSFSSIWDLELLALVIAAGGRSLSARELESQMRGSQLVVDQGIRSLSICGIVAFDGPDQIRFSPVNETVARCAQEAVDFYRRFPGRTRRLMIARQAPGLSAFANAFRLRKDDE